MSESDQTRSKIIQDHPIANGLDAFRAFFRSPVMRNSIDLRNRRDAQDLTWNFLVALQALPVSRILPSKTSAQYTVQDDILRLRSAASSDDLDSDCIRSLVEAALADNLEDALIWDRVVDAAAVLELASPPRPMLPSFQQPTWLHHISSVWYSSERRPYIDYRVIESELGQLRDGLSGFHATFFGSVEGLETAAAAVFQSCTSGSDPLFRDGWKGWPTNANEDAVLWLLRKAIALPRLIAGYLWNLASR
nr:hypothetical protein L203_04428 [Cryptococcus depauperatus CBS 7841]